MCLQAVHAARGDSEPCSAPQLAIRWRPSLLGLALGLVDVQVVHQHYVVLRLQQPVAPALQPGGLMHKAHTENLSVECQHFQ